MTSPKAKDSTLSERTAAAIVWAAKTKTKIGKHEIEEEKDEEKKNEKADITDGKTKWCVTVSADVGRVCDFDWQSG